MFCLMKNEDCPLEKEFVSIKRSVRHWNNPNLRGFFVSQGLASPLGQLVFPNPVLVVGNYSNKM